MGGGALWRRHRARRNYTHANHTHEPCFRCGPSLPVTPTTEWSLTREWEGTSSPPSLGSCNFSRDKGGRVVVGCPGTPLRSVPPPTQPSNDLSNKNFLLQILPFGERTRCVLGTCISGVHAQLFRWKLAEEGAGRTKKKPAKEEAEEIIREATNFNEGQRQLCFREFSSRTSLAFFLHFLASIPWPCWGGGSLVGSFGGSNEGAFSAHAGEMNDDDLTGGRMSGKSPQEERDGDWDECLSVFCRSDRSGSWRRSFVFYILCETNFDILPLALPITSLTLPSESSGQRTSFFIYTN